MKRFAGGVVSRMPPEAARRPVRQRAILAANRQPTMPPPHPFACLFSKPLQRATMKGAYAGSSSSARCCATLKRVQRLAMAWSCVRRRRWCFASRAADNATVSPGAPTGQGQDHDIIALPRLRPLPSNRAEVCAALLPTSVGMGADPTPADVYQRGIFSQPKSRWSSTANSRRSGNDWRTAPSDIDAADHVARKTFKRAFVRGGNATLWQCAAASQRHTQWASHQLPAARRKPARHWRVTLVQTALATMNAALRPVLA